ncbi:MAG: NAD-dependent epimerase/dehydratase family protein, partial [Bryobacteraceae bacterium]
MKIVVIGGTGLIGSKLVSKLRERGHEAVAASPKSGVNSVTGDGLADALKGASVVVDVTNSPSWEDSAVLKFFETSTRNLLSSGAAAGV